MIRDDRALFFRSVVILSPDSNFYRDKIWISSRGKSLNQSTVLEYMKPGYINTGTVVCYSLFWLLAELLDKGYLKAATSITQHAASELRYQHAQMLSDASFHYLKIHGYCTKAHGVFSSASDLMYLHLTGVKSAFIITFYSSFHRNSKRRLRNRREHKRVPRTTQGVLLSTPLKQRGG